MLTYSQGKGRKVIKISLESQRKSRAKYQATSCKTYALKLVIKRNEKLIEKLEQEPNKQQAIKKALEKYYNI